MESALKMSESARKRIEIVEAWRKSGRPAANATEPLRTPLTSKEKARGWWTRAWSRSGE